MTRSERRHRRARELAKWLRVYRDRIRGRWGALSTEAPLEWARQMLGHGSLSVQGCPCCSRKRHHEGPRFSERRRMTAVEDE